MRTSWLDGSWVISPSRGRGDLRRDPGGQRLGVGLWGRLWLFTHCCEDISVFYQLVSLGHCTPVEYRLWK